MELLVKNRWLLSIHALAITMIVYASLVLNIFSSPQSVDYHLALSGGYNHLSNIVKDEIESRLPPEISDKILQKALAQNLLNTFVTPQSIQKIAQPLLKAASFIIAQEMSIQNDKVVVNTTSYRERLTSELSEMKIPDSLQNISQKIVAAIPNTITLVDLQKRPNSILAFLTKAEVIYQKLAVLNWIFIITAIITFLMIIIFNLHYIKQILLSLALGYLIAGAFVVIGSIVLPYIISNFIPQNPDPVIGDELNLLVSNSISYFFNLSRKFGWLYLVVGSISYLLWRWQIINSFQDYLNNFIDKPTKTLKNSSTVKKNSGNLKKK